MAAVSWNQIMPFLPLYLKELGVGDNIAQWSGFVFAVQSTAGIVMQPLWGSLGDRYGRKTMVLRAGFCLCAIYYLMSYCTAPWQLAVLRFLNGALTGFIPGSMTLIATNTPVELSAGYVAIAQTASAAGGILGPAIGGLLAGVLGYRDSMRVSGTAVLIATMVVWLLVQERNKACSTKPMNLFNDFRTALTNPIMSTIMTVTLISWAIGAAIQPILTLYLEQMAAGGPQWLNGVVFSLPGLAFLIMGYRWSAIGSKITFQKAILAGIAGSGLAVAALASVNSIWAFSGIYFIMGIFSAALAPCSSAVIALKIDEEFRGRAYGMQQSAGTLGGLIAPLLSGAIGGYLGLRWVFGTTGLLILAGAVIVSYQMTKWAKENAYDEEESKPA